MPTKRSIERSWSDIRDSPEDRSENGAYFSQPHLIREDPVDALFVQICQPVETFELVFLELSHEHMRLRNVELSVHQGSRILEVELFRVD